MLLAILTRWEDTLNEEAEESERAFLGEEPFSVLVDMLRFLELALWSGMNRLSASLIWSDPRRRVNSSAPSSASKSSSR